MTEKQQVLWELILDSVTKLEGTFDNAGERSAKHAVELGNLQSSLKDLQSRMMEAAAEDDAEERVHARRESDHEIIEETAGHGAFNALDSRAPLIKGRKSLQQSEAEAEINEQEVLKEMDRIQSRMAMKMEGKDLRSMARKVLAQRAMVRLLASKENGETKAAEETEEHEGDSETGPGQLLKNLDVISGRKRESSSAFLDALKAREKAAKATPKELHSMTASDDTAGGVEMHLWLARARAAFRELDSDGSGCLSHDEFKVAMVQLGVLPKNHKPSVLNKLLSVADKDGDGEVSIEELIDLLTKSAKRRLSIGPKLPRGKKKADEDNQGGGDIEDGDVEKHLDSLQAAFGKVMDNLVNEHTKRRQNMVVGQSHCMIDPRSDLSFRWDAGLAILLIVTMLSLPVSLAFEDAQRSMRPFNILVDFIFIADILKHFNTGYLDDMDFAVMDRQKVSYAYGSTWFVPDLVSSVPFDLFDTGAGSAKASKVLKLLRLSRLSKLLRLLRFTRMADTMVYIRAAVEDHLNITIPDGAISLMWLLLGFFFLVHWVGCVNYMIARIFDFPEDSWVVLADIQHLDMSTKYSWCLFKSLSQLIGLGFTTPPVVNTNCDTVTEWCAIEHWITLLCLYMGYLLYAMIISKISFIVINMNKGRTNLVEKVWAVNEYMRSKKIPPMLRSKVRNFFKIQFSEGKMYNEGEILGELSPNLANEILLFNQRNMFELVPLLSRSPATFSNKIALAMTSRVFFGNEFVFEEGSVGHEMFFISSGVCEIVSSHSKLVVKAIADGCYFGDVACILHTRRTAGVRAKVSTVLFSVSDDKLNEVLSEHPHMTRYMQLIAQKRKVRLAFLDPANELSQLSPDQIADEEDAGTKYFCRVENIRKKEEMHFMKLKQGATSRSLPSALRSSMTQNGALSVPFHSESATQNWRKLQGIFQAGVHLHQMTHHQPIAVSPTMPGAAPTARRDDTDSGKRRGSYTEKSTRRGSAVRQPSVAGTMEDTDTLQEISGDVLGAAVQEEQKHRRRKSVVH